MKKYIPWFLALVLMGSTVVLQWLRADKELAYLDARLHLLNKELYQIDTVRKRYTAFQEELTKIDMQIEAFQKRLPSEPGVEIFKNHLTEGLRKQNVVVDFLYSDFIDKDFYKETILVFSYNDAALDESVIRDFFQDIERLVRWKINVQDKLFVTRIYSAVLEIGPSTIKHCGPTGKVTLNYWPFNKQVKEKAHVLEQRCRERNENHSLYTLIKQLEDRRRLREILSQIVTHLDPEHTLKN